MTEFPNKTPLPGKPGPLPPPTGQQQAPKKEPLEPIVSGAKQVKRPVTKRLFNFIFAESPKEIAPRVGRDLVVPHLKMGVEAAFNAILSNVLWGNDTARPTTGMIRQPMLRGGMTNYSGISQQPTSMLMAKHASTPSVAPSSYEDIWLGSKQDAELLLAFLFDYINQYNVVDVGSLYEKAGLQTTHIHQAYGWYSLDSARISPKHGGWLLELPRPVLL